MIRNPAWGGVYYYTPTTGCTDPIAMNYNELSIYDDGTCEYYEGNTFYVAEVNDSEYISNGSPERPYTLIQDALDNSSVGQIISVDSGLYEENIIWPNTSGIKLYGVSRDETIIDGQGIGTVIQFDYTSVVDTEIKHLTIQDGSASDQSSGRVNSQMKNGKIEPRFGMFPNL